ncbi:helix-turn-helix transcriptional regulator [Kitasatospora sp. NPDC058046]|uniref:helix-turn-helix domain-containing protein n=1 Tax=Kitasatospora sp. NPDC058046 TaxID=3346312 RepID=UPI0036DE9930
MPTPLPVALGDPLSRRELQVMRRVINGQSNSAIATELDISPYTVKTHLTRIFRKLGARDRAHACGLAIITHQLRPAEVRPVTLPTAATR